MRIIKKIPRIVNKSPIKILKFSVSDWLEKGRLNLSVCERCHSSGLYILETDDGTLLYVGMTSRSIAGRLFEHYPQIGYKRRKRYENYHTLSKVGQVINQNLPQSLQWSIYLVPLNDDIEAVEEMLIRKLQPTINTRGKE